MLQTISQNVKLIDNLANREEGKEIEKSKVRINGSLLSHFAAGQKLQRGTATTELASLNIMGKMRSSTGGPRVSIELPKTR